MRQTLLLVLLAACTPVDEETGEPLLDLDWQLDASDTSPLAALARVELDEPAEVRIELWSDDVDPMRTIPAPPRDVHGIDVIGMRAETTYALQPVVRYPDGDERRAEIQYFTTGALPEGTPDAIWASGGQADGLITVVGPAEARSANDSPYLIGVDREGFVVWVYDPDELRGERGADRAAQWLHDGNLRVLVPDGVRVITPGGEMLSEYSPPSGMHHDGTLLDIDHLAYLARETQTLYVDQFDATVPVLGDVIAVTDQDANEVWRWSAFEHLDPQRFPTATSQRLDPNTGSADWTHANSLVYDMDRDAYIVSLRHQNWVIAVDATSGEVEWTLGAEGDFALEGGQWFTSQHAARTLRDGTLLMFDNGNDREGNSRAVRYALDEQAMTATEVWSFDVGFSAGNLGDADLLPNGSVLVCAGGQRDAGNDARIAEVTEDGEVAWELGVGDDLWVYRAEQVRWLDVP